MDLADDTITPFNNSVINLPALLEEINSDIICKKDWSSIVFLTTEENSNFIDVINKITNRKIETFFKLFSSAEGFKKLIEILLITKNKKIIKKLGYSERQIWDLEQNVETHIHYKSKTLNSAIKSLYFLCENLYKREAEELILKINENLNICIPYPSVEYFEIYLLYLMHKNIIKISRGESSFL